jgi:hypothetical protein
VTTDRLPWLLSPDEVVPAAKQIQVRAPHWSWVAALVGRIWDESLFPREGRARDSDWKVFCLRDLDLGPVAARDTLRLWDLMKSGLPAIELEAWLTLSRGRADVIRRAVAAGLELAEWFRLAQAAQNGGASARSASARCRSTSASRRPSSSSLRTR